VEGNAVAVASPAAGETTEASTSSSVGVSAEGVWLVECIPDDAALLAPHQALLTFHPDGMVQANFAVASEGALPDVMLSAGHGAWRAAGNTISIALLALLVRAEGQFAGTTALDCQGQIGADGQALDGTIAFALTSPSGEAMGEGRGTMRGKLMRFSA
jgi:hypothetical protein